MDPRVGESDSSGPRDLVAQGNRPSVLEQSNCGSGAVGDGVGQVPDRVVIEHVSVFEFRSACDRTALGFFLAARAEAHEGADDRAELLCLILIEVARLQDLDLPVVGLLHEQQVDQADDVVLLEPLELLTDLAAEIVALEADDQHLNRSERQAVAAVCRRAHVLSRSFCFCAANSSSVRTPCSCSCPSLPS